MGSKDKIQGEQLEDPERINVAVIVIGTTGEKQNEIIDFYRKMMASSEKEEKVSYLNLSNSCCGCYLHNHHSNYRYFNDITSL